MENLPLLKLTDLDVKYKRVMIRVDLNVPIKNGKIINEARIDAVLPTIEYALKADAAVILLSHRSRPQEGVYDSDFSLEPVADNLAKKLNQPVEFIKNWMDTDIHAAPSKVIMLENIRFCVGEKANDPVLAKKLAKLCDIFVMDAFGVAHRSQASTYGVAQYAPIACAGPLLLSEIKALSGATHASKHPVIAIIGGAKVSTKLNLLGKLIAQVEQLIVGGGIANTFIAASGYSIGKSLYEPDLVSTAKQLLQAAKSNGSKIVIPTDVTVATACTPEAKAIIKPIDAVKENEMILDIGPETANEVVKNFTKAQTIIWNGPIGVFEYDQFSKGTEIIVKAIAKSNAFSLVGGGETIAAIDKFGLRDKISYISTGGGAFIQFIEGQKLPAVEILEQRGSR